MSSNSQGPIVVASVNISTHKGTIKKPVDKVEIDHRGIIGDAHAGAWHRQISVLGRQSVERFEAAAGRRIKPGEFAENLLLTGIDLTQAAVLDRFKIGDVELEVTQIGKECHGDACAIFREVGDCVMPREGIFCRVITGGAVRPGDTVQYLPRTLLFRIVTLSDRAYKGEYEDRSGPRIRELLAEFLSGRRWHPAVEYVVLPDDPIRLQEELADAKKAGVDVVFTTGGTGIGPRDVTPDVAADFCDRLIPGVMESIRVKFGAEKPSALLSRSVAGIADTMLIYTLPGSVRAVDEYMGEIFKTLEHSIFMIHGLDTHRSAGMTRLENRQMTDNDIHSNEVRGAARQVEAVRISDTDGIIREKCWLAAEVPAVVTIEGLGSYTLMCTPTDTMALAVGFAFSEGIISSTADIKLLQCCDDDPSAIRMVLKQVPQGPAERNMIVASSCGLCGIQDIEETLRRLPKVPMSLRASARVLVDVQNRMKSTQELFQKTGGTHAAAVFAHDGAVLAFAEDVGRHNALDKAIGRRLLEEKTAAGCGVALSGRVSIEMVAKAAAAGIELIAAVSAPSSLAVKAAEKCGITLCGFVRSDRVTVFTHPDRIIDIE